MRWRFLLLIGEAMLCLSACKASSNTRSPQLENTEPSDERPALTEAKKKNTFAPEPLAPELLHCEGQSWGSGHLPNPFARYFSKFEGQVELGGEHAALLSKLRYTDAYGSNEQLFSTKKQWPWGKHPQSYVFRYDDEAYDLNYFDVEERALFTQFFFPQVWRARLAKDQQGRVSAQYGFKLVAPLEGHEPTAFDVSFVETDQEGRLQRLLFEMSDIVLGSRSFELRWMETTPGGRQVEVFEDNKITLSARCRKVPSSQTKLAAAAVEPSAGWQRVSLRNAQDRATLEMVPIDSDLFALKFPASNCQSLLLVEPDGLSVFEAPVSPRHSERLLAQLGQRFGDRPIKRVYVTHHHPAHAGGVATYAQAGIPIVTTAQNAEYFSKVIRSWRRVQPESTQREAPPLSFEIVRERQHFGLAGKGVVALNIGEASAHTDEHLVFFLEAQNLVFNGDLFYVRRGEKTPRPGGQRAKGLFSALSRDALVNDKTRIVAAWPIENAKTVASWLELKVRAKSP